jgi:hypothetical protein
MQGLTSPDSIQCFSYEFIWFQVKWGVDVKGKGREIFNIFEMDPAN